MCPFNPIRNWFIFAVVALGGAISSAWLALYWAPAIWFALGWIAAAIGAIFAASNALRTFCACASGIRACAGPCGTLLTMIIPMYVAFVSTGGFILLAELFGIAQWMQFIALAGFVAGAMCVAFGLILGVFLGPCQKSG
jgi:hypothetical protein